MRCEGYGTWSVCLLPVFLPPRTKMCTTRLPSASVGHEKVLSLAFSLEMLRSGIMLIFAYSTKAAILHPHTDTWPRGLLFLPVVCQ